MIDFSNVALMEWRKFIRNKLLLEGKTIKIKQPMASLDYASKGIID
jgi:hypothetical protein